MNQNSSRNILSSLETLSNGEELSDLARLIQRHREHKLDRFNIFDVLRVTWLELPHSNFLAFLLDPSGNHGWGTAFLASFLTEVCGYPEAEHNLEQVEVLRERDYIDILLIDALNQRIVIIENKITSDEGEGQLESYWCAVQNNPNYQGWDATGIFLTPKGIQPSFDKYRPVGYDTIVQLVDALLKQEPSVPHPEDRENIIASVRQYSQMLRRHIVADKKADELSQRIIREHYASLQYLNNYFSSWKKEMVRKLANKLKQLIGESPEKLFADLSNPNYIRFGIASLRDFPELNAKHYVDRAPWTPSGQLLLFVLNNQPGSLVLDLYMYCDSAVLGDQVRPVREELEARARSKHPFHAAVLESPWLRLYRRSILPESAYHSVDEGALMAMLVTAWKSFIADDFLKIEQALKPRFLTE